MNKYNPDDFRILLGFLTALRIVKIISTKLLFATKIALALTKQI
jgi:hypothetical protein